MGEAKRRKKVDPEFGQPEVYLMELFWANTRDLIAEVPFSIPCQLPPPRSGGGLRFKFPSLGRPQ